MQVIREGETLYRVTDVKMTKVFTKGPDGVQRTFARAASPIETVTDAQWHASVRAHYAARPNPLRMDANDFLFLTKLIHKI